MKKLHAARLGALALTLTLISTCLAGGTLARYTSEATGTGTANIAAWKVTLKQEKGIPVESSEDYTFKLADTKDENNFVTTDAVAPGDTGKIEIKIDGSQSEVAYEYKIVLNTDSFTATKGNIKFYEDAKYQTPWNNMTSFVEANSGNVGGSVDKAIYWKWEGTGNDTNDTTAGNAAEDLKFTVTLTAQQSLVAAAP